MKYTHDTVFEKESPPKLYFWNFPNNFQKVLVKRETLEKAENFYHRFHSNNNGLIANFHSFLIRACWQDKNTRFRKY